MPQVKICGISDIEHALATAEAGADYLGLVFAPSKRQISPQNAARIVHEVQKLAKPPQIVGVFVHSPVNDVNFIADFCKLDCVQLSGDENWDYCLSIKKPIIKAIHVHTRATAEEIIDEIKKGYGFLPADNLRFLLDSKVKGSFGGTGQAFDWKVAKEVSLKYPVLVAGGLEPNNVGQMVHEVKPWGVDVSSGVETGGKKDVEKIRLFVQRAKHLH
jgi:phosphoribosylanthranilate isomerase